MNAEQIYYPSLLLVAGTGRNTGKTSFIEADNEQAYLAFCYLLEKLPPNTPLICESGNLRNYLKPAVFILLHTNGSQPKISTLAFFELADKVIVSDIGCLNFDNKIVRYQANKWNLSI